MSEISEMREAFAARIKRDPPATPAARDAVRDLLASFAALEVQPDFDIARIRFAADLARYEASIANG